MVSSSFLAGVSVLLPREVVSFLSSLWSSVLRLLTIFLKSFLVTSWLISSRSESCSDSELEFCSASRSVRVVVLCLMYRARSGVVFFCETFGGILD
ncbi:hypothetical protein FKM82_005372 [Ascaphus truei]